MRRYIDIRRNYIQDAVSNSAVVLRHILTTKQMADGMTKPFMKQLFELMLMNLSIHPRMEIHTATLPDQGACDRTQVEVDRCSAHLCTCRYRGL